MRQTPWILEHPNFPTSFDPSIPRQPGGIPAVAHQSRPITFVRVQNKSFHSLHCSNPTEQWAPDDSLRFCASIIIFTKLWELLYNIPPHLMYVGNRDIEGCNSVCKVTKQATVQWCGMGCATSRLSNLLPLPGQALKSPGACLLCPQLQHYEGDKYKSFLVIFHDQNRH